MQFQSLESLAVDGVLTDNGCTPSQCQQCSVRHLAFCSVLSLTELKELEQIMQEVNVEAGTTLVLEDEPTDFLYSVTQGCVKLYKSLADGRCQNIGFLLAGDFLGNIHSSGYLYTAEAVDSVRLCRFPRAALEQLFTRYQHLERRLFGIVDNELSLAREQMLLLGRKTAKERVASFLIQLYRRAKRRQLSVEPLSLPMTRADMADYLGLTTESVSRVFTKLRQENLLALPKSHHVLFLAPEQLEALSEGD